MQAFVCHVCISNGRLEVADLILCGYYLETRMISHYQRLVCLKQNEVFTAFPVLAVKAFLRNKLNEREGRRGGKRKLSLFLCCDMRQGHFLDDLEQNN